MKLTPNYNLNIPEDNDRYNKDYYNSNFITLDIEIQRLLDIINQEEEEA